MKRSPKSKRSDLTDLELTTLGIVWKRAPCTAYAIMQEFAGSTSSYYRQSAGSIYPLVQRLTQRRLLSARSGFRGRQPQVCYSLTKKGLASLKSWITDPVPPEDATIPFDPLRARTYFLGLVTPRQRKSYCDDAERLLREQLRAVDAQKEQYRKNGDRFSAMAMDGVAHVHRARLAWINKLRKNLDP